MSQFLQREINKLKKTILMVGTLVEESLRDSIHALTHHDAEQARRIIEEDTVIDQMEVEVEEECLKILALHQPVAVDLRYIISVLKINNDLERIGDLATNIAERCVFLSDRTSIEIPDSIPAMAEHVQDMLKKSLDALISMDADIARKVVLQDDVVDELHVKMYPFVKAMIESQPKKTEQWLQLLAVSRYLERAADHCTNIAEDIEYLVTGNIIRHA